MVEISGGVEVNQLNRLEGEGGGLVARLQAFQVIDAGTFAEAADHVKTIDAFLTLVANHCDPNIKRWYEGHKAAIAERDRIIGPSRELRRVLVDRMGAWEQAERNRQRAIEEAARREAERVEREAREAAARESARLQRAAEDARLEEAARLEAAGDHEGARRKLEVPTPAPLVVPPPTFVPPPPTSTVPKVAGLHSREGWEFVIENAMLIPREFLMVDEVKVRKYVAAMGADAKIPGVAVVPKRTQVLRKGK